MQRRLRQAFPQSFKSITALHTKLSSSSSSSPAVRLGEHETKAISAQKAEMRKLFHPINHQEAVIFIKDFCTKPLCNRNEVI